MKSAEYPVQIYPLSAEDGGGWAAEAPDLPGCMADGETPEEAISDLQEAIESWIATAEEFGDSVPEPSAPSNYSGRWLMRVPKSLHMRLASRAKREGVSLNSLALTLIAEGMGQKDGRPARKS